MKPGTIPRLLDYYFTNEEFAMEGHFNEWLVYDFVLKNGRNLLRDFCDRNPCNLPEGDLKIYKDLQNNEYSIFEVLKVEKGKGLELLSLQSGKKYFADEFMGTFQIAKGNIFPGRIGKVGDHWELIGANSLLFNIKIDKEMKKYLFSAKDKITPKTIYDIFLSKNENKGIDFESEEEKLDLEEIEKQLEEKLEYLKIDEFVSVNLIKKWISDLDWKRNENVPSIILSMLVGLMRDDRDESDIEELVSIVSGLYNLAPQKYLGGKSPYEMRGKKKFGKDGVILSNMVLGRNEWLDCFRKAFKLFENNKHKEALEYYDKCFESLLKEKTANSKIYRLFANKAMAHFAFGEEKKGLKMLEIALKLNPNYDFGRDALRKYENGEYNDLILGGSLERLARGFARRRRKLEKDPAIVYFNYLEKFNINFATKELTVSDITIIGPNGKVATIKGKRKKISRNDPCPCGSGKKYKKCCMGK